MLTVTPRVAPTDFLSTITGTYVAYCGLVECTSVCLFLLLLLLLCSPAISLGFTIFWVRFLHM